MSHSSPEITFDNRLLAVEQLFKQRKHSPAMSELSELEENDFAIKGHELGLYYLLRAEAGYFEANYKVALDSGLKATRILADYSLNRRYGRVQLIVSKCYSALGDLKNAEIRASNSLASYRRASEEVGQVDALNELARISHLRCNYRIAAGFLTEALTKVEGNARKEIQLKGNLSMIRIRIGQWNEAEADLAKCIEYNQKNGHEISLAINLLALGYLQMRQRKFIMTSRQFDQALEIISRLSLKNQKVIYLEYAGELAFEKGDMFKAKSLLSDAYHKGMLIAPNSALVTQSSRRLAEVELELDNIEEAMKYAQKSLDISTVLGERLEIGLSQRVIAKVFAAKADLHEAVKYIDEAVVILREVGERFELARTLQIQADIKEKSDITQAESVISLLKESARYFNDLGVEYWVAEANFQMGVRACSNGNLARGFRKLNRAEKVFTRLNEESKVRAVSRFLRTLSDQAVALSVSQENHFKVFGNLISPADITDMESSRIEDILSILLKRAHADRALVYAPGSVENVLSTTFELSPEQDKRFCESFEKILGEEISRSKPTLILDSRRDPYMNSLFHDVPDNVASVIVIPFRMSDCGVCFLYLDRISRDNSLDPFSQDDLNFAVGFSDIIGFKWTEILKNKLLEDNRRLKTELADKVAFPNIITQDSKLLDVLGQVQQVVDSNISIAIEGATGSGKDLLAKAIHYGSNRRDKRFISVNCAALPENLLESELFGFKRGAFTGADHDKPGLFEEADGGSFFLDEIADMPLSIQAKILRVLEAKEIVRLGETTPRQVDVRVISATNKDLKAEMAAKTFRQDLYYRLSAFSFRLPPLNERKGDVPLLVSHFMENSGKSLSSGVFNAFEKYDWPGNVRELDNEIKKLILLSGDNKVIETSQLSAKFNGSNGADPDMSATIPEDVTFDQQYSLYDYLNAHEKRFIIEALKEKKGVKKHAAALLNIPESTLRLKIKQYNIDLKQLDI